MQQLADKAALPEKRLCYRNRAPVCFHTWGNSGLVEPHSGSGNSALQVSTRSRGVSGWFVVLFTGASSR